ncbi:MAG TPA: hypothetical protein H9783_00410 [Candidatus Limosilactobacillus faecipullorum]|nr:hypothetical protein [Candidatus Limosilactobacillus faecipullorum]
MSNAKAQTQARVACQVAGVPGQMSYSLISKTSIHYEHARLFAAYGQNC